MLFADKVESVGTRARQRRTRQPGGQEGLPSSCDPRGAVTARRPRLPTPRPRRAGGGRPQRDAGSACPGCLHSPRPQGTFPFLFPFPGAGRAVCCPRTAEAQAGWGGTELVLKAGYRTRAAGLDQTHPCPHSLRQVLPWAERLLPACAYKHMYD